VSLSSAPARVLAAPTPLDRRAHSLDRRAVPLDRRAVPLDRRAVPLDRRAVPLDHRAVPLDRRAVPLDRRAVPLDRRAVPLDRHASLPGALPRPTRYTSTVPLKIGSGLSAKFVYSSSLWLWRSTECGAPAPDMALCVWIGVNW